MQSNDTSSIVTPVQHPKQVASTTIRNSSRSRSSMKFSIRSSSSPHLQHKVVPTPGVTMDPIPPSSSSSKPTGGTRGRRSWPLSSSSSSQIKAMRVSKDSNSTTSSTSNTTTTSSSTTSSTSSNTTTTISSNKSSKNKKAVDSKWQRKQKKHLRRIQKFLDADATVNGIHIVAAVDADSPTIASDAITDASGATTAASDAATCATTASSSHAEPDQEKQRVFNNTQLIPRAHAHGMMLFGNPGDQFSPPPRPCVLPARRWNMSRGGSGNTSGGSISRAPWKDYLFKERYLDDLFAVQPLNSKQAQSVLKQQVTHHKHHIKAQRNTLRTLRTTSKTLNLPLKRTFVHAQDSARNYIMFSIIPEEQAQVDVDTIVNQVQEEKEEEKEEEEKTFTIPFHTTLKTLSATTMCGSPLEWFQLSLGDDVDVDEVEAVMEEKKEDHEDDTTTTTTNNNNNNTNNSNNHNSSSNKQGKDKEEEKDGSDAVELVYNLPTATFHLQPPAAAAVPTHKPLSFVRILFEAR